MNQTGPLSDFEINVRNQLHAFVDHAPTDIRDTSNVALRPTSDERPPKRRIAVIGAAVIALTGGAALTTIAATGNDGGGQSTPQSAVLEFIEAIENRDVLGALDVLDPGESAAMIDVAIEGVSEAERIGLLVGADLNDVGGASAGIEGLVLSTEKVAPDVAVVHFDAGTLDIGFDLAMLPFSDQLRDRVADEPATTNTIIDLADETYRLATVQRDGEWYVSVGYTIAETVRQQAGGSFPLEGLVASEGFDTPEAAASAFWQSAAALDVRSLIATVAPGEADAVARYAPLWLDDSDSLVAEANASGFTIGVSDLTYEVTGDDDVRRVDPTGYIIDGTFPPQEQYDFNEPFDATAPTVISSYDPSNGSERFLVIEAGEPVPDSFDLAEFDTEWPADVFEQNGRVNNAGVRPDGSLEPYWSPTAVVETDAETPQPFTYEFADGCTTMSGAAYADLASESALNGSLPSAVEQISDGVWRSCGESSALNSMSAFSIILVGRSGFSAPEIPPIDVIEIDGRWYVSPIRTVFASVFDITAGVEDGGAFSIDSPIGLFIYGTDRSTLENMLVGRTVANIAEECSNVVTTDGEIVTGIVDEVAPDDAQRCAENGWLEPAPLGEPDFFNEPADSVVIND